MATDPETKAFLYLFRWMMPRTREEVPPGKTDWELIREGSAARDRQTVLLFLLMVPLTLLGSAVLDLTGLTPRPLPGDVRHVASGLAPWLGPLVVGFTLLVLLSATPWSRFVGGEKLDRAARLSFEAEYQVSLRRVGLLFGLLSAALAAACVGQGANYLAYDREHLRWRVWLTDHRRPLSDLRMVNWYLAYENGGGRIISVPTGCLFFKDGTRLVVKEQFAIFDLDEAGCVELARLAGLPAPLRFELLPKQ